MMRFSEPVRERILVISNLTSNFSGIPLAFAFIVLLGNSGLFTCLFEKWGIDSFSSFSLYGWGGLLLMYIYFQLPLSLMLLYPIYYGIQQQWKDAAALTWGIAVSILEENWDSNHAAGDCRNI